MKTVHHMHYLLYIYLYSYIYSNLESYRYLSKLVTFLFLFPCNLHRHYWMDILVLMVSKLDMSDMVRIILCSGLRIHIKGSHFSIFKSSAEFENYYRYTFTGMFLSITEALPYAT